MTADRPLVEAWGWLGPDGVLRVSASEDTAWRSKPHAAIVTPFIAADRLDSPELAEALCIRLQADNPEGWSVQDTLAALRAHLEGGA